MKKTKVLLGVLLAFVVLFAVMVIPAMAAVETNPSEMVKFDIATDKEEYTSEEEIKVSVNLENKNKFPIRNIVLKEITAEGFEISNATSNLTLGALAAGETMSATYTLGIEPGNSSVLFTVLVVAAVIAALVVIAIIVFVILKKKKAKASVTSAVCLLLLLTMLPTLPIGVFAQDTTKAYSAMSSVEIKVDGKDAVLNAELEYYVLEDDLTPRHTVSFNTDGGSEIAPVEVEDGQPLAVPEVPVKDGFIFTGWFVNEEHSERFIFEETKVTGDMTLYADWVAGDVDAFVAEYIARQIDIVYHQGDNADYVTHNIGLPVELEGVSDVLISWASSSDCINTDGTVIRPEEDQEVTLTVCVERNDAKYEHQHVLTVIHKNDRDADTIQNSSVIDIENMNPDGDLEISYNSDKSQVTSIEGKYSEIVVENADDALDALRGIHTIVGITDPYNELKLLVVNSDEYGAEYTFAQVYNGYDVYSRRITVSADASGVTDSLGSGAYPTGKLAVVDTTVTISKEDAEALAENKYGGECKVVTGSTAMVYFTINEYEENPVFAYSVSVSGDNSEGKYVEATVFIDSKNGDIIYVNSNVTGASADTGSGKNEQGDKVTFPIAFTWTDWYFFYMQDLEREIQMYDQILFMDFRIGSEFNWWTDETAISAYTNIIKTYDWYKNTLGRESVDGNGLDLKVVVHDDSYYENAFWRGSDSTLHFCDNSPSNKNDVTTSGALDVVAHEFTHGVFQYITGGVPYSNAPGAINEGYADIFGCLVEGDWQIGEDWKTLRDASNPTAYSAPDKLSSPFYIDYTVDSSDNGGVHTNSSLVYHAAYLMNKYGMSKEVLAKVWYKSLSMGYDATSDFHTVRRNVLKAAKKMNLEEDSIVIIKKAFDEVEIYGARGTITGKVTDVAGNPIVGAEVTFEHNGVVVHTTKTDEAGTYSALLDSQNYSVTISANDYVTYVAVSEVAEEETVTLNATLVKEGNGTVKGTVVSATSAMTISDVTLNVRSGLNMKTGTVVKTGKSNASGEFTFELEAGYYTIEMLCDGYTTGYVNVLVNSGEAVVANGSLSPIMTSSTYRVVLTWGRSPEDLDSHLIGQAADGSTYHVYYSDKHAYNNSGREVANLDVDDTTSYGPETTTFIVETTGKYEFIVHRYSSYGSLPDSGATVEVYNGTRLIAKYTVDSTQSDSYRYWEVFTIENGIFKTINEMS